MHNMLYFFHGEDLVVEVLLELLVGEIDAELLETVGLKVLKSKNVQNTCNKRRHKHNTLFTVL